MAMSELIKRLLGGSGSERRARVRRRVLEGSSVLVVDDSATIRAVLGKMLSQEGYAVLKAADGEASLQMAREHLPDLIFLDIVLPGINGFAVLRALRRDPLTRRIPIVMISGNLQATEQFYVQRFGADDFMKKPFGRAEVFDRIRRLRESGRLTVRDMHPLPGAPLPAAGAAELEPDSIPDIAMPDPCDLRPPQRARDNTTAAAEPAPTELLDERSSMAPGSRREPHDAEQHAPASVPVSTPLSVPPGSEINARVAAPEPLRSDPRHWTDA